MVAIGDNVVTGEHAINMDAEISAIMHTDVSVNEMSVVPDANDDTSLASSSSTIRKKRLNYEQKKESNKRCNWKDDFSSFCRVSSAKCDAVSIAYSYIRDMNSLNITDKMRAMKCFTNEFQAIQFNAMNETEKLMWVQMELNPHSMDFISS